MTNGKILVYSCSGCSSAAQMANKIAIGLDRKGIAEMSCIAGVGGGVPSLVKKAKEADTIVGIDGCPLACVKACLKQQGLSPTQYYELTRMGVQKKFHQNFDFSQAEELEYLIAEDLCGKLNLVKEVKRVNSAA